MVSVESEIFCLALERSSAGKPSASPQRNTSSRAAAVAQIAQPARELLRGELLAGGIEQDDGRGWIDFQFAQSCRAGVAQLADFDFGVVLDALDVVAHHGASFFAAGLAEHDQADFHARTAVAGPSG